MGPKNRPANEKKSYFCWSRKSWLFFLITLFMNMKNGTILLFSGSLSKICCTKLDLLQDIRKFYGALFDVHGFLKYERRHQSVAFNSLATQWVSLEKLLWNVKFYLNQYFSQTYSHEIVRRNLKLTRENLNLDSKIKHLSPVYKKKKTSKSCADDSKASLVWVKKRTEHDLTLSPNLFFWASSTWCRRPKYFPYVHIYKAA